MVYKMEEKILEILGEGVYKGEELDITTDKLLNLFSVSNSERIKKLEFMIDNGLHWDDLKDDNKYPID